ncbi:hypothetical protein J3Q64DRAFT_1725677 [Phycomyces blakesleeanus]|uniref:Uncharacterized protein n=2 Tax=Phycomyces blakesleeanus TaxID=4837 RepID=A0A162V875_PHYB8|nr:hypothetical protein PHYBLDRAFT_161425 [Phycomyces blakesleeanus NRRL 1555(-)]OAD80783.1 hypothetical protein PHYBLDRAFT_161425 [Phycomyces blakesleeanus NRRL 1555(-)]|eukprot:XP_018298823.1 hypothetical protein PHYBLDRAFT_161425 [Phycomyces blakesleeanus NRRL 1555(-)]
MPRLRRSFGTCALLYISVLECYGLPENTTEDTRATYSNVVAFSVIKAIVFAYLAHSMVIRPSMNTISSGTFGERFLFLAFPTFAGSLVSHHISAAWYGDRSLGIENFKKPLEVYSKTISEEADDNIIHTIAGEPSGSYFGSFSAQNDIELESNPMKANLNMVQQKTQRKSDWLVDYGNKTQEFNIEDHDNATYLAALLQSLGPDKAKKLKHCLLNSSLFVGFDLLDETLLEDLNYIKTDQIRVIGLGVACKYQASVAPSVVRYLPTTMLDQLYDSSSVDRVPYKEVFITLVQLGYTVIECLNPNNENKWIKSVLLVYMIMSMGQTLSILALHTQEFAFSVRYRPGHPKQNISSDNTCTPASDTHLDKDFGCTSRPLEGQNETANEYCDAVIHKGSFLYQVLQGLNIYTNTEEPLDPYEESVWNFFVVVLLFAMPFLLGIWADYASHSTTEWLVLA